jgi:ankyrin repeat protein
MLTHVLTQGETALMAAAAAGNHWVVENLLEHGANPALRNSLGRTAWDLAKVWGNDEMASRLLPPVPRPLLALNDN